MINTKKEAIVGAFILISLIIMGIGIFSFGNLSIKSNYYTMRAMFNDVNNLSIGSPVLLGGVKIGRVNKIYLNNDKVIVEMLIQKNIKISKKARISVVLKGVIGDMIVSIYNPDTPGEIYAEGDVLAGDDPMTMSTFFKKANEFIDKAEETVNMLEKSGVTENLNQSIKSSKKLFDDTDRLVNNLNNNVVKNINESLSRVDKVLIKIEETLPEKGKIDNLIDKIDRDIDDRNKDIQEALIMVTKLLKSVDYLIKSTDDIVKENKDEIATAVKRFEMVSERTLKLVESIDGQKIEKSVEDINEITTDIKTIIKDIKGAVGNIDNSSLKKTIKNTEKLSKGLDTILDTKLNFYPELEINNKNTAAGNFNVEFYNKPTNIFIRTGKNDLNNDWGKWNIIAGKKVEKFNVGIGMINDRAGFYTNYKASKYFDITFNYYDLKENNADISANFWIKDLKLYFKYNIDEVYYGGIGYRF